MLPSDPEKMPARRGWDIVPVFGAIPFGNEFHATLRSLEEDPDAPGFSDVGLRNLVFTHVLNLRPEAVLEIGSHIGTASVVIGQALKLNGFGRLFTVEPQAHYQGKVEHYVRMAGVGEFVEVVKGFSHEGGVRDRLRSKGPFELIFVDANHDYVAAKEDIRFCWSVLANDGFLLFHDTSRSSQSLDSEGRGGVRAAIIEAAQEIPDFRLVSYEYPLWLNPCGAALACKQDLVIS